MNEYIKSLENLNKYKDAIIREIRDISTNGVSKTQAQNLREYATQTRSADEMLLYLQYQMAREKSLQSAGNQLAVLIKRYKPNGMVVIRYLLGTFARWVMIQDKLKDKKG